MVTQSSKPSGQVRSPTTPMGEESVTPVSQPSRLGELSASMFTEPDMKHEAIQRAQVGSLMGANGNKEPQDKTPRKRSPALATRPKKYALEMWVEIETSTGVTVYGTTCQEEQVKLLNHWPNSQEKIANSNGILSVKGLSRNTKHA